jgi:cofilin
MPKESCRFAIYDFSYTTDEKPPRTVEKLLFIYWSPDESSNKERMSSAVTKEHFKKNFNGIVKDITAKDLSDVI